MLRRDCNHPSVIIWSVGNEVDGQGGDFMCQTLKMLADYVKAFDPTRPVTFAMEPHSRNGMWDHCPEEVAEHTAKMMEHVDLICGNYSEQWYEAYHKRMPEKLIIGTEIFQYYSGYRSDPRKMRDYHPLNFVRDSDYVIGSFLWAGSDYLGESFCWPARAGPGPLWIWRDFQSHWRGCSKPTGNPSRWSGPRCGTKGSLLTTPPPGGARLPASTSEHPPASGPEFPAGGVYQLRRGRGILRRQFPLENSVWQTRSTASSPTTCPLEGKRWWWLERTTEKRSAGKSFPLTGPLPPLR